MQRAIINIELPMVQVMHFGHRRHREIISTVLRNTHQKHADEESVEGEDMYRLVEVSDECEREHNRYDIGEEMLYGRGIKTCEGDGRGETVVQFVVASIKPRVVEDAVDVVGQDFASQMAVDEISHRFFEGR